MNTDSKIFNLIEVMLQKCEDNKISSVVNLSQSVNSEGNLDYVYELSIPAEEGDDFLNSRIDYNMAFCFGEDASSPFIMINYSDTWQENIKFFDKSRINKLKRRIEKIYTQSRDKKFESILRRTMDYFDIEESEIRDIKIKNLLEDE